MNTYFIKTFGCAMNFSDSERLASFLESYQIKPVSNINQAVFVIINTCGVRQMAEDRVYGQIHNLKKTNPNIKIILTGCVSHRPDVRIRLRDKIDLFTDIKDFPKKFSRFISENSNNTKNDKIKKTPSEYLSIIPKHISNFQANVPIMTGCNNFCSYCVVPYARGRETSRPSKEIIKEVKNLINSGYKEITLLGQNVNSYKSPTQNKLNFSELLKKVNDIPGEFWIRFMSSHPKDMSDELIETITSLEKVCEYIHLPIQSGSNAILKKMNRKYTRSHYLKLIEKIKKSFEKNKPKTIYSLSTDIIVGFPGETKNQFSQSVKVMQEIDYDMVYFGQFSPRPGTAAWTMKDNITKQEKVYRENFLNEILKKSTYKNNKKYVGKIHNILIEKEKSGFYYGKTRTFKNVKITISKDCHPKHSEGSPVGKIIPIQITKANIWNLEGEVCKRKNLPAGRQVIVILGPTASGKSSVAIKLAKKFNGEIISTDSRQIFKGMDIGSGKVTGSIENVIPSLSMDLIRNSSISLRTSKDNKKRKIFISKKIPHYMLDIVSPNTNYNVAKFKKQSLKHIEDILSRGKIPILCGGTGFWIKAIVDDINFPQVKPDWKLRKKLENKKITELIHELKKLDPERSKTIDLNNKVRLIRAIEICKSIGKVPTEKKDGNEKYEFLQIGINRSKEELHERIRLNVKKRFKNGMVKEVKNLHEKGVSWKKLKSFGLSYSLVPEFIKGEIETKEELLEKIYLAEKNYAKRQITWFNRDKRIKWIPAYKNNRKNYKDIEKEVKKFLEK